MPYPSRIDLRDSRAQHLYSILPSSPPLPFPLCVRYIRYTRSFVSVSSVFFFPLLLLLLIYHARIPRYPVTYLPPPSPRPIRRIIFSHALERQTRTSPTILLPPSPVASKFHVLGIRIGIVVVACVNTRWREIKPLPRAKKGGKGFGSGPWKRFVAIRTEDERSEPPAKGQTDFHLWNPAGIRRVATANVNVCPPPPPPPPSRSVEKSMATILFNEKRGATLVSTLGLFFLFPPPPSLAVSMPSYPFQLCMNISRIARIPFERIGTR